MVRGARAGASARRPLAGAAQCEGAGQAQGREYETRWTDLDTGQRTRRRGGRGSGHDLAGNGGESSERR